MTKRFSALTAVLLFSCIFSMRAQAQSSCSNASLNGNYFYQVSGVTGATGTPYAELGKFIFDGNGHVSGQSTIGSNGSISTPSLSGTYTVQANCTGTISITLSTKAAAEPITVQIEDGGLSAVIAFTASGEVIGGHAYLAAGNGHCGNGSLNGTYGFLLSGIVISSGTTTFYSNAGQLTANGNGSISSSVSLTNFGSGGSQFTGSGSYSIGPDCSGTTVVSTVNGVAHLNAAIVAQGYVLFMETDPGFTIGGISRQQALQSIVPQLVFGGGWYSAIYFSNTNASAASVPVSFTADAGTPLSVPGIGSSTQVQIPANGSQVIQFPNTGSLTEGYVSMVLPVGVNAYGLFRQSVPGTPDQEAVVPISSASSTSSTLTWDDTAYTTAVALANPSSVPVTVAITVWDSAGNVLGTSSVPLPPLNKTEAVLRSLPGLASMSGNHGTATFNVAAGNVAVLGLRFDNGSAFTSIPAVQQ